jgi:hypothetical protein
MLLIQSSNPIALMSPPTNVAKKTSWVVSY